MQVKREDVKNKLMESARREFLEHGYTGASLRVIAEKAGLTKGAVYSYFFNKDALFGELAAPAVRFIERQFDPQNNDISKYKVMTDRYEAIIQDFKDYARTVLAKHVSFKLLLFCAAGSSLQDYRERVIQLYAQSFKESIGLYMEEPSRLGRKVPAGTFSEMFIHTLANTYVSFLEEIVLHEPEDREVDDYAEQMAVFVHSGVEKLYCRQMSR